MTQKQLISLCLALLPLPILSFTCVRDYEPARIDHAYDMPFTASPVQKAYHLNDTIWLETEPKDKYLYDTIKKRTDLVDSAQMELKGEIAQLAYADTADKHNTAPFATITARDGQSMSLYGNYPTTAYLHGYKPATDADYHIKFGIAFQRKGTYAFIFPDSVYLTNEPYRTSHRTLFYHFSNTDVNRDVYDAMPDSLLTHIDGMYDVDKALFHGRAFIVKVE